MPNRLTSSDANYLMFRELNWVASPTKINIRDHWRLQLCVVVGVIVATVTWHAFFPHTFWFTKLWTGFATGATVGIVVGAGWQLHNHERRPTTSGYFLLIGILGGGLLAGISVFLWAPDLYAQEKERAKIRSLAVGDVSSIVIRANGQRYGSIEDPATIASFVACTERADLFYPSHEGSTVEIQITVYRYGDTSLKYNGRVPERHPDDFSLSFRGYFVWSEIIVPGGRRWLDSVASASAR